MTEFIINPIPYGGGTLQWTNRKIDLLRLNSSTRYIYAFSQTSPNYKFYGIADVANITGSVPAVNVIKQRAFTGFFSDVKLVALDDNRFVSYDGYDLYVYNTATNDVVEELKIANYGNDYNGQPTQRVFPYKISNDVLLEVRLISDVLPDRYKLTARKLTYNTSTSTFTITIDKTIMGNLSNTFLTNTYVDIKPIATSSTKILIVFYSITDVSLWSISLQRIAIYDVVTDTVNDITPASYTSFAGGNVIGFDVSAIVLFDNNSNDAIQFDGSSWSASFTYTADNNGTPIPAAGAFSPAYGILIRKAGSSYTAQQWFYRIVNYQGSQNVVTSFPTNSSGGILVTYPSNFTLFYKKPGFDIFDAETFLINGYNSSSASKQFIVLRYKP